MSEMALVARCPAKVNLMLRVLAKRSDGYHDIETVFQALDLSDEVQARLAPELGLTCTDDRLPTDEGNLVIRAALRLRERYPSIRGGASFHLVKRIPVGGGLGGGSSDAAATLLLLSRLWGLSLQPGDLAAIGAELGADVPFFLTGGTALGTGKGDRIEPLPFVGEIPILLGIPPFGIATGEVYRALPNPLTPQNNDVTVSRLSFGRPGGLNFGFATNDLEAVVFEGWPELETFRNALLEAGAHTALLSGSGSAVFGIFETEGELRRALEILETHHPTWSLVPTRAVESGVRVESRSRDEREGARRWRLPRSASSPSKRRSSRRSPR